VAQLLASPMSVVVDDPLPFTQVSERLSFRTESSGVFASGTINTAQQGIIEAAVAPFEEPTAGPIDGLGVHANDDPTIPSNDLLFLMRVLVIVAEPRQRAFVDLLQPRIKRLAVSTLSQALDLVDEHRFDEVVVVEHDNTPTALGQLAALAPRARRGVAVLSNSVEVSELPGVRETLPLTGNDSQTAHLILALLRVRASA
jgi:hypothetical protein